MRSRMRHLVPQRGNTTVTVTVRFLLARVTRSRRARLGRGADISRAAASGRLVLACVVVDVLDVGAVGVCQIRDTSSAGGVTVRI